MANKKSTVRNRIFSIIQKGSGDDIVSKIFDLIIMSLIILNVISIYIETMDISQNTALVLKRFEDISVIIFTIEYILRVITAPELYPEKTESKARLAYVFSFMALIDLIAIVPWYLPLFVKLDLRVLRALRLMRLTRLLKFNRYTMALNKIFNIIKAKSSELLSSIFIVFILMMISSILMYNVENKVQPDVFKNAFSGFWWAVATFTTVGYGDIYPITALGRILGAFIAILGIGFVAIPTGIISTGFMEQAELEKEAKNNNTYECGEDKHIELKDNINDPNLKKYIYCPYCGKKMED